MTDDFRDFHQRWPSLLPPLRPHRSVAEAIGALLRPGDLPVLLLGVTPELAAIPDRVIALDWSTTMIATAWPGDTSHRRALCGDWLAMPLAQASVGAAISDGALTMLAFPEQPRQLFDQLRRVVAPGGRIVIRCFATPEPMVSLDEVCAEAQNGTPFHLFKLRFNMAAALETDCANIASAQLYDLFQERFPDRAALAAASGWSLDTIAEIDAYRASRYVHCYPSRNRIMNLVPDWVVAARFVETSGYPGAEICPLLVIDLP